MIRKLTLAVGFGAGYVLGAKAGKERYTQIEAKFRELLGQPAVQEFTSNVSSAADKAKSTVNDKVSSVGDKVASGDSPTSRPTSSATAPVAPVAPVSPVSPVTGEDIVVVDLGASGAATTGPVLGASPSGTAPDVR